VDVFATVDRAHTPSFASLSSSFPVEQTSQRSTHIRVVIPQEVCASLCSTSVKQPLICLSLFSLSYIITQFLLKTICHGLILRVLVRGPRARGSSPLANRDRTTTALLLTGTLMIGSVVGRGTTATAGRGMITDAVAGAGVRLWKMVNERVLRLVGIVYSFSVRLFLQEAGNAGGRPLRMTGRGMTPAHATTMIMVSVHSSAPYSQPDAK
jgi:hypothetical protein